MQIQKHPRVPKGERWERGEDLLLCPATASTPAATGAGGERGAVEDVRRIHDLQLTFLFFGVNTQTPPPGRAKCGDDAIHLSVGRGIRIGVGGNAHGVDTWSYTAKRT